MRQTTTARTFKSAQRFKRIKNASRIRSDGFTLVEVMIVIAVIAAVLAIGAPRLFSTGTAMRAAVREMGIVPREARNFARLFNITTRLVISMDEEKGHTYWVESGSNNAPLISRDQEEELSRLTRAQREDELTSVKTQFQIEKKITSKPKNLPRGLYFEGVEYPGDGDMIETGTTYIHFFSKGLADAAAIHLTDRKTLNWTITINPLTGRAEVFERKVSLKELSNP